MVSRQGKHTSHRVSLSLSPRSPDATGGFSIIHTSGAVNQTEVLAVQPSAASHTSDRLPSTQKRARRAKEDTRDDGRDDGGEEMDGGMVR